VAESRKRLYESSISSGAASFAIWLSKMILATRSSAKTFLFGWEAAGASIPTCSTENGRASSGKESQRIENQTVRSRMTVSNISLMVFCKFCIMDEQLEQMQQLSETPDGHRKSARQ
jgi:hypothetical protein